MESQRTARPVPAERVLLAALLSVAGGIVPPFLVGALAVQMSGELGLSASRLGLAVATFFLTAGIAAVTVARRATSWGWQRSMRISATGSLATLLAVAGLVRTWQALLVAMVSGGVFYALAMPASNVAVARDAWRHRQGLSFGIRQGAVPATMAVAGLSIPLIALTAGWRWVFVSAVVLPAMALLAVPPGQTRGVGDRPAPDAPIENPRMVPLAVAGGIAAGAVSSLSAFFVLSSVAAGIDSGTAGKLLAVGSGLGVAVRVSVGWAADRFRFGGFKAVVVLLSIGTLGFLALATGTTIAIVAGSLVAFGGGWGWPGLFHFGVVDSNPGNPAGATGIAQTGLSSGAALGPLTFGLLVERTSFSTGWIVAAVAVLIAAFVVGHHVRVEQRAQLEKAAAR